MKLSLLKGLKFVTDYFELKRLAVLSVTEKSNKLQILVRNSKTRKNETYFVEHGELKKLIHTKNKYQPWNKKTVARHVESISHIDAMRAAVNESK